MSKKDNNQYIPRLLTHYKNQTVPYLMEKLNIKNINRLPKIEKVVLNIGLGDARDNANALKNTVSELSLISGQKPVVALAKKPISNFKIRQGDPVGVFVTLRRNQMYEFLDRFISSATPRIRDFRGLPNKGFDGMGNYNFGVNEQVVFPEINYDKVDQIRGMNITIVTSGQTDKEAYELLLSVGLPIRKKKEKAES
tara:strand:+ start:454 stop:1041 length:588 start_codon:yes stop_codon:yes gene_type:complete